MSEEPSKVDLGSPDLAAEKREAFEDLFPGVLADGVLDATRLGELLDTPVAQAADARERFGLMWAGKQESVRSLLKPSRGALVPDLENSIEFDTAQNVFIEGDNLEVLKLLQKAYNDKVKLIYIDPPYNTGNDFVYNDDFSDGLRGYLEYTGQLDEEGKLTSATAETAGRMHSRWLSMMYPRLVLARNLLSQDGVIAVSIDANEVAHLRMVLNEIFGAENYLNTMVWVSNLKGRQIGNGGAVGTHEYLLVYARSADLVNQFRGRFSSLKALMPSVYKGGGYEVRQDDKGPYVTKNELYNTNSKFNERTAPTMVFRIHYNPETEAVRVTDIDDDTTFPGFVTALPHKNSRPGLSWHAWRWSRAKVVEDAADLEFRVDGTGLRIWTKIRDVEGVAVKDIVLGPSTLSGQSDLKNLGLERVFDNPKPVALLQVLVGAVTSDRDLILDFFAGSGSTAHAVALQNEDDGHRRRCVSVNLPEPTPPESEAARLGFTTVSAITLARLRRVVEAVPSACDQGLRCFSLAPSNFMDASTGVRSDVLELRSSTLISPCDMEAVAAEVLVGEGVTLDSPWRRRSIAAAPMLDSDGVAVVMSLDITEAVVDDAISLKPRVLVFLEDGFAGRDAVKANAFTRARNAGITMKTV
jgi:adenine-specific DNA-methyltransferase